MRSDAAGKTGFACNPDRPQPFIENEFNIRPMNLNQFIFAALLIPTTFLAGCGSDDGLPARGDVEGYITLDGEPIAGVMVMFQPKDTKSRPAMGMSDETGWYRLVFNSTATGTVSGLNGVQLEQAEFDEEELAEEAAADPDWVDPRPALEKIPNKYYGEFMEVDVQRGDNDVDIALVSTPDETSNE